MSSITHSAANLGSPRPPEIPRDDNLSAGLGEQLSAFLRAFYPDPYETVHIRAFAPKDVPKERRGESQFTPWTNECCREQLEVDEAAVAVLRKANRCQGIYFVVNAGGNTDDEITRFNACFAESDDLTVAEQHARLDACPLPPSIRVETAKSVHAYWLLKTGAVRDEWERGQLGLIAYFKSDSRIKNPSRVMRLPGLNHVTYHDGGLLSYKRVELVAFDPGVRYSVADLLAAFPPPPEPEPTRGSGQAPRAKDAGAYRTWDELNGALRQRVMDRARRNGQGNYEMACPVHNGKGDTSLFYNPSSGAVACLADPRCSHASLLQAFGLPAFPIKASHFRAGGKNEQAAPPPMADEPNEGREDEGLAEELRCTDMGNGLRFARGNRTSVRYSYVSGKWYIFDGRRWKEDDSGEVFRLAKQTVKGIYAEAAHTEDEEKRKALAKWATTSESDSRMRAMLHQAESELPVRLEAFDADPLLFNCANGTVDLRTGKLRPHDRRDMLSKFAEVEFDESAQAPRWLAFLDQIFGGDKALIGFIQKAAGYSLTGDTSEQCFFISHGTGANGKSVLLKTLMSLLGEYGQQVQTTTLMIKSYQGVNNDIAALRGARFCSAVETDSDHRLAEALVKQLTGGDRVRARFLFQEAFEFTPAFKLWLAANHKPQVKGDDHAIWRRIKLIPFNVTIPKAEQNPHLDAELREELPGVLAWAVEGCLRWQREGLGEPEAITKATQAYREEMDLLADFIAEKCAVGEQYQATTTELYNAYETWCQTNGEKAESAKWLGMQLRARGFKPGKDRSRRFYEGIGLIRDTPEGKNRF